MARLTKAPTYEKEIKDLGGGLNQASPPNDVVLRECIELENFRVSEDGRSKVERKGLSKIDAIYSFASKKVFGIYGIEETDDIDLLACLEDDIQLKSGNEWSSIFSPVNTIDKQVSIAQDKGLVFVAGYEKLITVKEGEAFYSGVEPPQTAPTVALTDSSTDKKALEYPASNQDHCGELRVLAANTLLGQSFKLEIGYDLTKVSLKLRKIGSPTGNLWVEIHSARGGTSESKETSTYIVGQATDDLDVSTLTGSFATKDLTFSGTKPGLEPDITYYLVVYGSFAVDATNYVEIGVDVSSPSYSNGRYWKIDGSLDWTSFSDTVDMVFEVYGTQKDASSQLVCGALETGQFYGLREDPTDTHLLAQEFVPDDNLEISSLKLALKNNSAVGGSVWVEIHSSEVGTSETKNASANIVGQASDNVACSSIPDDYTWVEFTFSGTKPTLTASSTYYVVFYCTYSYYYPDHIRWTINSSVLSGVDSHQINDSIVWSVIGPEDFSFELIGKITDEVKALEYAFTNIDDIKGLRETADQTILAQEFQVLEASSVSKIKLYLAKYGTPTGNLWVEIHSAQGETSGTKGNSTNIVGQASDDVDIATYPVTAFPTYGWVQFDFSGTKPALEANKEYWIVIYGSYSVSATDYIKVGQDKVAPTYSNGMRWEIPAALDPWASQSFIDIIFELYMLTSDLIGEYSYLVTYYRGGNYPCESNPSPVSETLTFIAGKSGDITAIPVSPDSHVTQKMLYRTKADLEVYYWLATLDNATTTFEDNISDNGLGDEVSYDNYVPPEGDFMAIWDDTLWVTGVEGYKEGLWRSRQGYLEQFHAPAISYVPLREDQADRAVRPVEFNNFLFTFKTSSIWVISRSGADYVIDKVVDGTGTIAGSSIAECNMREGKALIFLSNHYKIELMDGYGRLKLPEMSDKVKDTLASINKDYAHRSVAQNYIAKHEYRLAIPTGSSTVPNKVIVFDYLKMNFYVDTHYQNMSSLSTTNLTPGHRETIFGTDSGDALKIDEDATTDDGQIISSKFRTGWWGRPSWKELKRMWLDYILPANKNLIFKIYSNFRETPDLSITLAGSTPSGVDAELRNIIHKKINTRVNGNYYSFYFANAEDVGGDLEVIQFWLYLHRKKPKDTVKAA